MKHMHREYVAICRMLNEDKCFAKLFDLPETIKSNNRVAAQFYFKKKLIGAVIMACITKRDYLDLTKWFPPEVGDEGNLVNVKAWKGLQAGLLDAIRIREEKEDAKLID